LQLHPASIEYKIKRLEFRLLLTSFDLCNLEIEPRLLEYIRHLHIKNGMAACWWTRWGVVPVSLPQFRAVV